MQMLPRHGILKYWCVSWKILYILCFRGESPSTFSTLFFSPTCRQIIDLLGVRNRQVFINAFSLPLLPSHTPPMAVALGNSWLLFYISSSLFFSNLSSPPSLLFHPLPSYFLIYILLFSGHIHLQIVMIAVRSSAMACRKSELVHVSKRRYALWTPAGSFTDCWIETLTCSQAAKQSSKSATR